MHRHPGGGANGGAGNRARWAPDLYPAVVARLIGVAISERDSALVMPLSCIGQWIGEWSAEHGRPGVLGMSLAALIRQTSTVVGQSEGARDEHRVPATGDLWAVLDIYLRTERGNLPPPALWVAPTGPGPPATPRFSTRPSHQAAVPANTAQIEQSLRLG